ncbi:MAG: hypothetical protein WCK91_00190 [bacterium]
MPPKVIVIHKNKGQTPLECIEVLQNEHSYWAGIPMTYAGRLDPLACGVLLVLTGEECKKKEEYTALSKEYEVEVLFGFETDTYDVMGKVEFPPLLIEEGVGGGGQENNTPPRPSATPPPQGGDLKSNLALVLENFTGKFIQKYPPYSSRTVAGKPLYQWAREGRLGEIEMPSHEVSVESIGVLGVSKISGEQLLNRIKDDISKVKGDFRQEDIVILWEKTLEDKKEEEYDVVKLRISCSGGFYVRQMAHDLGGVLGTGTLALNIVRTKVGEYMC